MHNDPYMLSGRCKQPTVIVIVKNIQYFRKGLLFFFNNIPLHACVRSAPHETYVSKHSLPVYVSIFIATFGNQVKLQILGSPQPT